jgi:hypothetical protein
MNKMIVHSMLISDRFRFSYHVPETFKQKAICFTFGSLTKEQKLLINKTYILY